MRLNTYSQINRYLHNSAQQLPRNIFMCSVIPANKFNINGTKWDQTCYTGRALHFFKQTDPRNLFATDKQLDFAKSIVSDLKAGKSFPNYTDTQLWDFKYLYDSAFHPETGEKQFIIGRMSAQVPCNMLLTAGLLGSYRSTVGLIFFQWLNQSFNSLVNYTNRSGKSEIPLSSSMASYALATSGAVGTALMLNRVTKKMNPLIQRLVPFVSIAAANILNISVMRYKELQDGIAVYNTNNDLVGFSKNAAKIAIGTVVFSRIAMAAPGLVLTPLVFNSVVKRNLVGSSSFAGLLFQTLLCGFFLIFATPLCCALFAQDMTIDNKTLESDLQNIALKKGAKLPQKVHFNKGL